LFSHPSATEAFAFESLAALVFPFSNTERLPHASAVVPFSSCLNQSEQFGRTQSAPLATLKAFVFRLLVWLALRQANSTIR